MRRLDLLLVAALIALMGALAPASLAQETPAGKAAGVNPAARGIPPITPPRQIFIGLDIVRNERILTEAVGQLQILFLDRSTLTIGPNAEVVIDEFVYAPATSTGRMALSAGKGVFRYVGGAVSKREEVTIATPAAVIGIRGGIVVLEVTEAAAGRPAQVIATLLHGVMRVIATNGVVTIVRRPGYSVTVIAGQSPDEPRRVDRDLLNAKIARLEGLIGGPGRAPELDLRRLGASGSDLDPRRFIPPGTLGPGGLRPRILPTDVNRVLFDSVTQSERRAGDGQLLPPGPPPPLPPQPPLPPPLPPVPPLPPTAPP